MHIINSAIVQAVTAAACHYTTVDTADVSGATASQCIAIATANALVELL